MAVIVSPALYLDIVQQSQARFDTVLNCIEKVYRLHMEKAGRSQVEIDAWIKLLRTSPDPIGEITKNSH